MNKDTFQVIVFFGGLIFMFCIETLFSARKWEQGRGKRLCFHLGLSIFNGIILRFPVMIPLIMWQQFIYDKGWGLAPLLGLVGPIEIAIGFIVLDFFDYIWHRINHEIPFLWRFHKVHHVDTHVDVTTALRFHPGELVLSTIMKSLWILVWGPSLWAFAIFESGVTLFAEFHHSNIDFPDKVEYKVRKIFVTPRYHAAHHTVTKRTGDANYSTIFIFWDKLAKTYQEPDYEELKKLGLEKGRATTLSFLGTLKGPFSKKY